MFFSNAAINKSFTFIFEYTVKCNFLGCRILMNVVLYLQFPSGRETLWKFIYQILGTRKRVYLFSIFIIISLYFFYILYLFYRDPGSKIYLNFSRIGFHHSLAFSTLIICKSSIHTWRLNCTSFNQENRTTWILLMIWNYHQKGGITL